MISDEIKELESKKLELEGSILIEQNKIKVLQEDLVQKEKEIKRVISCLTQEINKIDQRLVEIQKMREKRTERAGGVLITDHAIVRYFERVLGFDMDKVKNEIVSEDMLRGVSELFGKCRVKVGNTHHVVVDKGTVITVVKVFKPLKKKHIKIKD